MTRLKFLFTYSRMSSKQQVQLEMPLLNSGSLQCQLPKRFIVTILGFIGMFNVFAMRMNMSVAIVAMVNSSSSLPENNTLSYGECPAGSSNSQEILDSGSKAERYNWDSVTQGQVIGAFSYGSFITVFTGGYLAERFGGHRVFGLGVIATSVLTLLTPVTVRWGLAPLLTLRALEGLSEGVTVPAMASIVSKWAPMMERSRMTSFIFSGAMTGSIVTYCVCGWLCSTDFLGGWPSAFYVFGIIGCIWYLFWWLFVYESPFKHPSITEDEFQLYEDNMKISKMDFRIPWFCIFSSIPFWAVVLVYMGSTFADVITATELPTYLSSALHVDVQSAGMYSAVPGLAFCVGTWISSYAADNLRKREILNVSTIRKICSSIAGYMIAISLISVPFCGCRAWLVITIYSLGMFMNGFKFSGFQVSIVDMSPTYAGIIYSMANGISSIAGVLAPLMVGAFTQNGGTITNWGKAFYVAAVISAVTTTIFVLFSSSELQPWGKPDCETYSNGTDMSGEMQNSKWYKVKHRNNKPRL